LNLSPDLLLLVVAVLAVGCGISVGWILCEKHRRAHPEGVAKMAAAATAQIEMARMDAEKEIARQKVLYDETKEFLAGQLGSWQAHAHSLSRLIATPPPVPVPTPPEPPRTLDPSQSVARVTGEGVDPETELRDKLIEKAGLSPEKADAILQGKVDNVPLSDLLDNLTDGIIRDRTGVT
jgi:hypothetical protein